MDNARAWAEHPGATAQERLSLVGITNAADQQAVMSAWDEDTVVDVALKNRAYGVFSSAVAGKFSEENKAKLKAALLAEKTPSPQLCSVVLNCFPVAERAAFEAGMETVLAQSDPLRPARQGMILNYNILQGLPTSQASDKDLTAYLLAAEPLDLNEVQVVKQMVKDHAIRLARVALRADGKSFVTKDGVNPLAAKVQPVVDALNAPGCEGLEAALRALGADAPDCDRAELKGMCDAAGTRIMQGDGGMEWLGKVSIVLGVDGFNRFVDEYNNGKAGPK